MLAAAAPIANKRVHMKIVFHVKVHENNRIFSHNLVSVFTAKTAESLRIVDRDEWFARPSARELEPLKQPAIRVIIAYTAGSFATTHVNTPISYYKCKI